MTNEELLEQVIDEIDHLRCSETFMKWYSGFMASIETQAVLSQVDDREKMLADMAFRAGAAYASDVVYRKLKSL